MLIPESTTTIEWPKSKRPRRIVGLVKGMSFMIQIVTWRKKERMAKKKVLLIGI